VCNLFVYLGFGLGWIIAGGLILYLGTRPEREPYKEGEVK